MSNYLRMKGYIRNVSPTKRSSQGSFPYFNFLLQVNSKQTHRAVCYDPTKQKLLKRYQESKEPVTLGNIAEKKNQVKPSVKQLIVTKRSTIEPANINDIDYEYDDDSTQEQLTANHITSLLPNQVITVKTAIFFLFHILLQHRKIHKLQWNPVNAVINTPKKFLVLRSAPINDGFFFTIKCMANLQRSQKIILP